MRATSSAYRLSGREPVTRAFEYLLRQSAAEVTRTCGRPRHLPPCPSETHLQALEITHDHAVHPSTEAAKSRLEEFRWSDGFDTGFVSFARGWDPLFKDFVILWEHVVLEHPRASPRVAIRYWKATGATREVISVTGGTTVTP